MTVPGQDKSISSAQVWGSIIAIVLGIAVLSTCSQKSSTSGQSSQFAAFPTVAPSANTPEPPTPMTELASVDLRQGQTMFTKIADVADPASAAIYSRNCYAALADKFTWTKLDRCGTFDAMAAQVAMSEEFGGSAADASYLESESAAQRYLAAGTAHGGVASVMDDRWAKVGEFAQAARAVAERKAAEEAAQPMDQVGDGEETSTEAAGAASDAVTTVYD